MGATMRLLMRVKKLINALLFLALLYDVMTLAMTVVALDLPLLPDAGSRDSYRANMWRAKRRERLCEREMGKTKILVGPNDSAQ